MFDVIAVPVDGSDYSYKAADVAIEIAQKFLERTKTEMPRDEIKKITEKDEITAEKMYQCYTYLFRTYFSPVVYNPFRCPFIFDNLLNRNKLAYIVVQPRKKRSKTAKSL